MTTEPAKIKTRAEAEAVAVAEGVLKNFLAQTFTDARGTQHVGPKAGE